VDVAGGSVAAKLYNGLVRFNENGQIVSDLAESYSISNDGLEYTFKIRPDVKFCDGTVLTAYDVEKSFKRVISESPRKWIFNRVTEIKVLDPNTIKILLKERYSPFLQMLTMPNAYISKDGKIGTGPFELVLWEHDEKIILEKNNSYFGEPAKINTIEYSILSDEFTAQTEFELGNIDIMEVSPIQWIGLRKWKEWPEQFSQTGLNVYYIGFNLRKPLFQNLKFRQAVNYAIDRNLIIKSIMQEQAEPAWGPVPVRLLEKKEKYEYNYLPNKSTKLFNARMLEMPVKLYVRSQAQAIQIAEAVQYYLNKVGIRIIIVPLEWSAFKSAVDNGECGMFLMSWWADYADAENFLFPTFHSSNIGGGGNRTYFKNSSIDKIIEKAQGEMDPKKRNKLYEKLNRYISRQAPWVFLWNAKELYVTQPYIGGFRQYPLYNGDKGTEIEMQKSKGKS
jgi:peptide/nickel transport system substrate-binding protein/oligopeptide transport system substrate-binding protein